MEGFYHKTPNARKIQKNQVLDQAKTDFLYIIIEISSKML